MKMKLFKYGYLIRHAFDLGRIFPILVKQSGVSRLLTTISSLVAEAPITLRFIVSDIILKTHNLFVEQILLWLNEISIKFVVSIFQIQNYASIYS